MLHQVAREVPRGHRTVRLHKLTYFFRHALTLARLTEPLFWMHHGVSDRLVACTLMNRVGAEVMLLHDR
jgi:hypothetical protein